jgi:hypothetical protein
MRGYSIAMRVLIFLMILIAGFSVVDSLAFDARYTKAAWVDASAEGHAVSQAVGNWVTTPLQSN